MKVASWNVNSVNARLDHVVRWLEENKPDVLLLQELKCVSEAFPAEPFEKLGYSCAVHGEKAYNGVAILTRSPATIIHTAIPELEDEASRYIEVEWQGVHLASVYVPNGQEVGSDKYAYKMRFYNALESYLAQKHEEEAPYLLGGDFNVANQDIDVYDANKPPTRILLSPDEKAALRRLLNLGYVDSFRHLHPHAPDFSWWDYRAASFTNNKGYRIDYVLCSPALADRLDQAGIDPTPRGWEKPSDHVPCWVNLNT